MKRVARFGLLLLAVASVQGKTTDQLIDEVEDLLGKAPAVDAKSPAVVTKVESLVSAKTASLPLQQAGSAAMRFAQAQVGSAKEPLSPFSGAEVNLAQRKQEDTFVAGLQGSQLMQSVMAGRSIAPQQQIPQQQMPMQGMAPQMPMQGMPQQMPMQGMPQQMPVQGMPQQMPTQGCRRKCQCKACRSKCQACRSKCQCPHKVERPDHRQGLRGLHPQQHKVPGARPQSTGCLPLCPC